MTRLLTKINAIRFFCNDHAFTNHFLNHLTVFQGHFIIRPLPFEQSTWPLSPSTLPSPKLTLTNCKHLTSIVPLMSSTAIPATLRTCGTIKPAQKRALTSRIKWLLVTPDNGCLTSVILLLLPGVVNDLHVKVLVAELTGRGEIGQERSFWSLNRTSGSEYLRSGPFWPEAAGGGAGSCGGVRSEGGAI